MRTITQLPWTALPYGSPPLPATTWKPGCTSPKGMGRIQPLLLIVAEHDTMAPTSPAIRVAETAPRGELYRSRGGHYDVYQGGESFDDVLRIELEFLHRHAKTPAP